MLNADSTTSGYTALQQSAQQLSVCTEQILKQVEQQTLYAKELEEKTTLIAQSEARALALSHQKALVKITNRIRRSLDWSIICKTATTEVRKLLNADRVAIYRFKPRLER